MHDIDGETPWEVSGSKIAQDALPSNSPLCVRCLVVCLNSRIDIDTSICPHIGVVVFSVI